ncbi:hypothetical protein [Streptomyces sp. NPDC004376]
MSEVDGMEPAALLAAAVAELRSVRSGDDAALAGGVVPARLTEPLAAWLEICHGYITRSPTLSSPFRDGGVDVAKALLTPADTADPSVA